MSSGGRSFGQRNPPLSVTIRKILERYPDGQIFKEMIQNADDAGATVVQFYVDCRQHGTSNLVKSELASYQGPALISANNAVFSDKDWEGIQSLHESIKAEDPFKVGHFGIGFNSVYHLTDVPFIISGDKAAFLEPHETVWKKESGRMFLLQELRGTDHLRSLHGISNFSRSTACYDKTLFRFPLRTAASGLSTKVYSIQELYELIDALRSEAKFLLPFLRSVHTIEVYSIDNRRTVLSFQTKIADTYVEDLAQKRASFLKDVKSCYKEKEYSFAKVISFIHKFDIVVYDEQKRRDLRTTSHWLVANRIDSTNATVRAASVQQKAFPWVGTAVELDNPGKGRIFCFLPLPARIDTASNPPVHINGTFSLNDDRRNLKWPGPETMNDPSAKWNEMLVTNVLPPCYNSLLSEAKASLGDKFYRAWPDVKSLRGTQWESLLNSVLRTLLEQSVILTKTGCWTTPEDAIFLPKPGRQQVAEVVKTALVNAELKLAQVPEKIWKAFEYVGKSVIEVKPAFVCDKLRHTLSSYDSFGNAEKLGLLKYCLPDDQHYCSQLVGLKLLPLADGNFTTFKSLDDASSMLYLCSRECPKELLPNMDHRLVDVSKDADLEKQLKLVAQSKKTQLQVLDVNAVSALLDEAMPSSWKEADVVSFPNSKFKSDWFRLFWNWVKDKQLYCFRNNFILPVHSGGAQPVKAHFDVVRLSCSQPVLYIPSCSQDTAMLSVMDKFSVRYCTQEKFPYVDHMALTTFIKTYSPMSLLLSMKLKRDYASVSLSPIEAHRLIVLFDCIKLSPGICDILKNLQIFSSCINTSCRLYSLHEIPQQSLVRKVIVQPATTIDLSILPNSVIILSSQNSYQTELLRKLGYHQSNNVDFLAESILPHVLDMDIDKIMLSVLDIYQLLRYPRKLTALLKELKFVKVASGVRKCPRELFDSRETDLFNIFRGRDMLPSAPYSAIKYLKVLEQCGLRTSASPQEIIDVIFSISLRVTISPKPVNEQKLNCARAILQYLANKSFPMHRVKWANFGPMPFSNALMQLSIHRSWLPVLNERPSSYPSCLSWKGEGYSSHFVSLKGPVCVSSRTQSSSLPHLYGSRVYFTPPCDQLKADKPTLYLVPHFKHVIETHDRLKPDQMIEIVCKIYSAMQDEVNEGTGCEMLNGLRSMKEWVYVKNHHKFVKIGDVALEFNPSFRQHVEPYLYVLPDSLSAYTELFKSCGMNQTISRSQILSMLGSIKDQIHAHPSSVSPDRAWSTVMAILNWLTKNGTKKIGDSEFVLVPMESTSKWPDLKNPNDLVYCDNDYLKRFLSLSCESVHAFIHSRINQSLAYSLGITPLSEELDVSEDTFEDAGQYEPLVVRLKSILRDYKDGLTIIKELIQNADDAEATEVNICFDARTHTTDQNRLFFPDMCKAHGPALLVHNNSTFSDEDFQNIQKLAAATKQHKHLKIGKFGVGFCSVYHITDVPSFVSRNRLYIFDPTLSYLKKEVKNPSQPGKMVKFLSQIIATSRQMEPYDGLFGFKKDREYNGTVFRLPFRKCASELSNTCYSETTVKDLIESIQKCGDKLLLFLKHVKHITVQRYDDGQSSPETLHVLTKSCNIVPQTLSLYSNCGVKMFTVASECSQKSEAGSKCWLVATHNLSNGGKTAVANVACMLNNSDDVSSFWSSCAGEAFCYLPLSQPTGLPVHINCNFAVISNRRGIWTSDSEEPKESEEPDSEESEEPDSEESEEPDSEESEEPDSEESEEPDSEQSDSKVLFYDSSSTSEVEWNVFLMSEVIPVAYIKLLHNLVTMTMNSMLQGYDFYSLWPLSSKLQERNPWEKMVISFYKLLMTEHHQLFYSNAGSVWLTFQESRFLNPSILGQGALPSCVPEVLEHLRLPIIVDLPSLYSSHLHLSDKEIKLLDFTEIFFDSLLELDVVQNSRNEVVYHLLRTCALYKKNSCKMLMKKLESYACIPTTPHGKVLRKCSETIDPSAPFAKLFEDSDNMFPIAKIMNDDLAVMTLENAGMMHASLSWELIINRALSVGPLMKNDSRKAMSRVGLTLHTISKYTSGEAPTSEVKIDSIPFLPVMKRPNDYPLGWCGDTHELLPGNQLMLFAPNYSHKYRNMNIAGSQVAFLCEEYGTSTTCATRKLLNLRYAPDIDEVIAHLKSVIVQFHSQDPPACEWISQTCESIYSFIDSICKNKKQKIDLSCMKTMRCIWNGSLFLEVDSVAMNWKMKNGPYLYATPPEVAAKRQFASALGIKDSFTFSDIIKALGSMKFDFEFQPVSEECIELIQEMAVILMKLPNEEFSRSKELFLPDVHNVLHASTELVYNDVSWAPLDSKRLLIHSMFSRELVKNLGVCLETSKLLDKYNSKKQHFRCLPFGQHEELTQRIQNIIRDYPFDITVLKELLQNADDAKAEKMYIILDKRTHGTTSVISEKWKELQGPALLVWNDREFTEKDLEGIQKLGLGSKRMDADTVGQFGIGFNVVYHLTDCPSFVTGRDTLCVLDPHCRYVPEAKEALPGGRYDNLRQGFWKEFTDMGSAYLQTEIDQLSEEMQGGSLFRFPLRHSMEMVECSEIIYQHEDSSPEPLTAEHLSNLMKEWMPSMKQSLFFLNNVTEIKYFEIDSGKKSLDSKFHYKAAVERSPDYLQDHEDLIQHISKFTQRSGFKPFTALHEVILTDIDCTGSKKNKREKWLIQQGIGDLNDMNQSWIYAKTVKPKHAIAAPLDYMPEGFSGQLFCFLPLPAESGVPAHINGSFALNSTRRGLWKSSDPKVTDNKSLWNSQLYKAIASSYAKFLICVRDHYIKTSYKTWIEALKDLNSYYKLFPTFMITDVHKKWDSLACDVYKTLIQSNAEILCVFVSEQGAPITVEWHCLISENPANQVHFWIGHVNHKVIHPILQSLGLRITPAPPKIMDCFNTIFNNFAKLEREEMVECETANHVAEVNQKVIPAVSRLSVFKYYTEHSQLSSSCDMEYCPISQTVFKHSDNFLVFIKYLVGIDLEPPQEKQNLCVPTDEMRQQKVFSRNDSFTFSQRSIDSKAFPKPPFTHFLLLTADGNLRRFEEESKVLNCKFSHLFHQHLDKFLHPDLMVVGLNASYFAQPDDSPEQTLQLILHIFEGTFSSVMNETATCNNATGIISKESLKNYWECFREDRVFLKHLSEFLKHWTLLLTVDDKLFSTSSGILPAYDLPAEHKCEEPSDFITEQVCVIMKALKMPFLNISVVVAHVSDCPQLTNHDGILANFCQFNKKTPLISLLIGNDIAILIKYFSVESKPSNEEWLNKIRSLPFFVDVKDNYQRILNVKAFQWPDCCKIGYEKWIAETNTTFIQTGMWTSLGSADQLSINTITAERVYVDYIFPKFDLLSECERYNHLEHIRIYMYSTAIGYSETEVESCVTEEGKRKIYAKLFVKNLETVCCIGSGGTSLKPISAFCDHTVEIFRVFSSDFQSLPEQLQTDEWLDFFKELGLKEKLEKEEYLRLCQKVANGDLDNAANCSSVLLEYLFSSDVRREWYFDAKFLHQISRISFVPTADTSNVSWVVHSSTPSGQLIQLNGAAIVSLQKLLWTVRSIIELPSTCIFNIKQKDPLTTRMLTEMNVTFRPDVRDVVSNMRNISKQSMLCSKTLFEKYHSNLLPPKGADTLLNIIVANMKILCHKDNLAAKDFFIDILSNIPCIPVYSDLLSGDQKKMVLVEPSCVLAKSDVIREYHPYLHSLPDELMNTLSLLLEIGVKHKLELHHLQIVLQKLFIATKSKKVVNMNMKECVKCALIALRNLLKPHNVGREEEKAMVASLSPLYLPDSNDELRLSTTMIYGDTPQYFSEMTLDLSNTNYFFFDISKCQYGTDALNFCRYLPEKVRPRKMSSVCEKYVSKDCMPAEHSDTSRKIKKCIECESNPAAIIEFFNKFLSEEFNEDDLKLTLSCYFGSLEVITVHKLKTQLLLKKSQQVIGEQVSNFLITPIQSKLCLYIDDKFDDEDEIMDDIVQCLHNILSTKFTNGLPWEENTELFKTIKKFLKADTSDKKQNILKRLKITGVEVEHSGQLELGDEIPSDHYPWLDRNFYNIFNPMEYVGYEDQERNIVIVAQIVHLVQPVEGNNDDHLHRVYCIRFTREPDSEGKEVSVLDLYKFIAESDEDNASNLASDEDNSSDMSKIKQNLDEKLRDIWKLNPQHRKQALKRLFLQWHPDKNLDNPEKAKEVFTYLMSQINHFKRAEQLSVTHESDENMQLQSQEESNESFPIQQWVAHAQNDRAAFERMRPGGNHMPSPFARLHKIVRSVQKGKQWVKQAEIDYEVLCGIYDTVSEVSNRFGHVCFMAHQVAEKALKGGVYALYGMDESVGLRFHELKEHANNLEAVRPEKKGLAQHASQLEGFYVRPRYPNCWREDLIPANQYSELCAQNAKEHAETVLAIVKSIMPH